MFLVVFAIFCDFRVFRVLAVFAENRVWFCGQSSLSYVGVMGGGGGLFSLPSPPQTPPLLVTRSRPIQMSICMVRKVVFDDLQKVLSIKRFRESGMWNIL